MNRNTRTALFAALLVCGMTGMAFASVPLYRIFCEATGFGGTPIRVTGDAPGAVSATAIGIRFDANIEPTLPWKFEPEQARIRIEPGARTTIAYFAKNLTGRTTTGQAVFNVTPEQAGKYFSKIECFCFTEQTLKAGEEARMPVVFFVDPKLRTDPTTRDIDEITLSYTFYPVETASAAS
ncbi:MAG TPA: cytochrome c oxidase assembly protein [Sphingomicrobium sp.]|nr:cytochrome c oxidase assembly protein [Sphingomicrobium sp.]